MVVHVVRGDGLAGISAPQMGAVRELVGSLGASLHTVIGDNIPAALLEFAREMNATQLVLGTSRRSRWARMFDEGIGAAVVQNSGRIDVHMVTHEQARPGFLGIGGESALFFVGVLAVALLGGVAPAVLSAVFSGLLLNYFLVEPRHTFTISEPDSAITIVVLLAVAVAVAALVDNAASRSREAGRAAQEAELLTLFSGSVLRGADLPALLEKVRATYSQRAVALLRDGTGTVACVGDSPPAAVALADTAIDAGDDEFWLLLGGRQLPARDRRVLTAVAMQAAGLVRQRELTEEAGRAEAIARADELRRSLLSAVSHDLRTPLAAAKAAVSSLRADDVGFSPEDTAELLATVEESVDQLTALVGNLLDSSRLAAGVVHPELRPVYLEEVVQRALLSLPGNAVDRRYEGRRCRGGDRARRRRTARRGGGPLLGQGIGGGDEGPGIARGDEDRIFGAFQRVGDQNVGSGVGLGLSVARGFVEAMVGTISATETPGGGLTMVVDLPAPAKGSGS